MDLSPDALALKRACEVVINKMKEEGTWGQTHRVPEYVDSLLEHSSRRFPSLMTDQQKLANMRRDMIDVIMLSTTQGSANN
jgi:hypothetical protein